MYSALQLYERYVSVNKCCKGSDHNKYTYVLDEDTPCVGFYFFGRGVGGGGYATYHLQYLMSVIE